MSPVFDDHYELLGVDSTISATELRRVWRRLALRWHPDRAGSQATAIFQMLAAAYAVLSDPVARAAYDKMHRAVKGTGGGRSAEATPSAAPRPRVPAVMLARVTGPLESLLACGVARRTAKGVIELYLDEAESVQGGMVTIAMNVDVQCPVCAEQKPAAMCARCAGAGKVQERFSAWLAVPPSTAEGSILVPSVDLPGMIEHPTFRIRLAHLQR